MLPGFQHTAVFPVLSYCRTVPRAIVAESATPCSSRRIAGRTGEPLSTRSALRVVKRRAAASWARSMSWRPEPLARDGLLATTPSAAKNEERRDSQRLTGGRLLDPSFRRGSKLSDDRLQEERVVRVLTPKFLGQFVKIQSDIGL
jgi:hypothetical protein